MMHGGGGGSSFSIIILSVQEWFSLFTIELSPITRGQDIRSPEALPPEEEASEELPAWNIVRLIKYRPKS